MTLKATTASKNAALNSIGVKEQFTLGFLFIFSGPVPATADEALDVVADHTQLVKISNNSTATGLTFDNPASGVLPKKASETWAGLNTFDGVDDAETDLTATFFRLCAAGDNGRGIADGTTGYRLQGSVGGPSSGADLQLADAELTAGDTQRIGAGGVALAP